MADFEYRVGRFVLSPFRQLMEGEAAVPIGRKALDLLSVLAKARGALVTKDELMAAVWPNAIVEDNAIQVHIALLRKALGPDAALLRTVHGLGYRLAPTTVAADPPSDGRLPLPSKPSIAVMPFVNLSGDADRDYLCDGMVEEIVTALARFKSLFVIGSGSTLAFKGQAVGLQDIGRRLGVRYVLEGSVRTAGDRVRVSVKLSEAEGGSQVFAERFEDTLQDVFALQDRVASSVAGQIEPTLEVAEVRRSSARPTESLGSYELYMRAWALERTFVTGHVFMALDLLNRAIALDPDFAPALALAAICHRAIFNFRWSEDPEGDRRKGVELAHRALRKGAADATVLASAASALTFLEPSPDDAIGLLDRALALNSGSSSVWFYSGVSRLQVGQTDLGIEHLETALRLDPIGPVRPNLVGFLGQGRFQQRRFGEAVTLLKALVQETESPRGYGFLAASLGQLGQAHDAAEALAGYRARTTQPIYDFARTFMKDPAHVELFMVGIACAERRTDPSFGVRRIPR